MTNNKPQIDNKQKRISVIDEQKSITKVQFKSIQPYFDKERWGYKSGTLRKIASDDPRLPLLKVGNTIRIVLNESSEYFEREITDVTKYQGWYIISWRHI